MPIKAIYGAAISSEGKIDEDDIYELSASILSRTDSNYSSFTTLALRTKNGPTKGLNIGIEHPLHDTVNEDNWIYHLNYHTERNRRKERLVSPETADSVTFVSMTHADFLNDHFYRILLDGFEFVLLVKEIYSVPGKTKPTLRKGFTLFDQTPNGSLGSYICEVDREGIHFLLEETTDSDVPSLTNSLQLKYTLPFVNPLSVLQTLMLYLGGMVNLTPVDPVFDATRTESNFFTAKKVGDFDYLVSNDGKIIAHGYDDGLIHLVGNVALLLKENNIKNYDVMNEFVDILSSDRISVILNGLVTFVDKYNLQ